MSVKLKETSNAQASSITQNFRGFFSSSTNHFLPVRSARIVRVVVRKGGGDVPFSTGNRRYFAALNRDQPRPFFLYNHPALYVEATFTTRSFCSRRRYSSTRRRGTAIPFRLVRSKRLLESLCPARAAIFFLFAFFSVNTYPAFK